MRSGRSQGVRTVRRVQGARRRCETQSFSTGNKHNLNRNEERTHLSTDLRPTPGEDVFKCEKGLILNT